MQKFLFSLILLMLCPWFTHASSSVTEKFYSNGAKTGPASDGRMFEDRFTSWYETINNGSARIASSDDNNVQDLTNILGTGNGPGTYGNNRLHFGFDTSALPDNAEINSAKLYIHGSLPDLSSGSERRFYVVSSNPVLNNDIQPSDYGRVGNNSYGLSQGVWSTDSYTTISLNTAGIAYINKYGVTNFALRGWYDFNQIAPTNLDELYIHILLTEEDGTDKDPYLEITYTLPEEETLDELIERLVKTVEDANVAAPVKQSYLAHIGKLPKLVQNADTEAQINQLEAFIKQVEHDLEKGNVSSVFAQDVIAQATTIIERLQSFEFAAPLLTQVVSPYPSTASTTAWASQVYAGGRASTTGDCGLTIEKCGCALTSLSMLARHYGVLEGHDGSSVDPGNMNDWLLEHGGYTKDGSILWTYALAYLGEGKNGTVVSPFGLGTLNATNTTVIQNYIRETQPALLFNRAKGHWMLGRGTTKDGYYVNDPFWYETKTTGDAKDVANHVQSYDNVITKANLFEHHVEPKVLDESLEIVIESPAELLLVDGKGRRLGYESDTDVVVDEMETGTYDREDFVASRDVDLSQVHKAKRLIVTRPESNVFELSVIGTGEGEYDLTTVASDGKGGVTKGGVTDTTSVGETHRYTVMLDASQSELPSYLKDILDLIPARDQKKFVQAFTVIFAQTEKGHVAVTETLVRNLIRYIESKYGKETWSKDVVQALEEMVL